MSLYKRGSCYPWLAQALCLVVVLSSLFHEIDGGVILDKQNQQEISRKLITSNGEQGSAMHEKILTDGCSMDDVAVYQGATGPLPNGIPTYTVNIHNRCTSGCAVSNIHLSCGWFSSARLINPSVFRRLSYDDCLVNDGGPLGAGQTVSFQYADTFQHPLAVSSATSASCD